MGGKRGQDLEIWHLAQDWTNECNDTVLLIIGRIAIELDATCNYRMKRYLGRLMVIGESVVCKIAEVATKRTAFLPLLFVERCVKNGLSLFLFPLSLFFRSLSFPAWATLENVSTWRVGVNAWEVLQGYEARSSGTIGKSSIGYCSDLSIGSYCII